MYPTVSSSSPAAITTNPPNCVTFSIPLPLPLPLPRSFPPPPPMIKTAFSCDFMNPWLTSNQSPWLVQLASRSVWRQSGPSDFDIKMYFYLMINGAVLFFANRYLPQISVCDKCNSTWLWLWLDEKGLPSQAIPVSGLNLVLNLAFILCIYSILFIPISNQREILEYEWTL